MQNADRARSATHTHTHTQLSLSLLGVLCLAANFCIEGARLVMTQYLLQVSVVYCV
jgi:hypothetical protein